MRSLRRQANAFPNRVIGPAQARAVAPPRQESSLADDLRLFALTFGGGFLFMAVYLA